MPLEKAGFQKEIIVVDDGSTDGTFAEASRFKEVRTLRMERNGGKGKAVQAGIKAATGDYVLVQDGDLEYDPRDYSDLLKNLSGATTAVYGSRPLGQLRERGWSAFPGRHPNQGFGPWVANLVLSLWTFLLYGRWITDTLTAYKVYPTVCLRGMAIKTAGFETDHEITAKLIRTGVRIVEVPIHYEPRSREMGKKIRARDGFIAVWTLLRFRWRT